MEKKFELTDALRLILDKVAPSPENLAEDIFTQLQKALPDIDDYSLLAFCVIFISKVATSKAEYLTKSAKSLYILFNYAHYLQVYEKWQASIRTISQQALMQEDGTNLGLQDISSDTSIEQTVKDIQTKI